MSPELMAWLSAQADLHLSSRGNRGTPRFRWPSWPVSTAARPTSLPHRIAKAGLGGSAVGDWLPVRPAYSQSVQFEPPVVARGPERRVWPRGAVKRRLQMPPERCQE
jgi:hypothetical protein